MNPQIKEQLEEEEETKDAEANEEAARRRAEDETLEFRPELLSKKAVVQYLEAVEFKYLDAFINFDETKKLLTNMRTELSEISEEVQVAVRNWLENGAKKHNRPHGVEPQTAITLIGRIPQQEQEVARLKNLADYYQKLIGRLTDEFLPKAHGETGGGDAGPITAMPTAEPKA